MGLIVIDSTQDSPLERLASTDSCAVLSTLDDVWEGDSIRLLPNEKLTLGETPGARTYNPYAKVGISTAGISGLGLKVSDRGLSLNDIVLTLWPDGKKIVPAAVKQVGNKFELELATAQPKDARCFVVDESASHFLTISMGSTGDEIIRLVPPQAIDSWMVSCGSATVRSGGSRFKVERNGAEFEIADSKKSKIYVGRLFNSKDEILADHEVSTIKRALASKGLGALLPIYKMTILENKSRSGNEP